MRRKVWYVRIDCDEVCEFEGNVKSWFDGVCQILATIEKGVPFTCSLDFFYREGDE